MAHVITENNLYIFKLGWVQYSLARKKKWKFFVFLLNISPEFSYTYVQGSVN